LEGKGIETVTSDMLNQHGRPIVKVNVPDFKHGKEVMGDGPAALYR
jgi:hypothetical protein